MTTEDREQSVSKIGCPRTVAALDIDRSVAKAAIERLLALRDKTKPVSRAEIAAWIKEGRR